MPVQRPETLLAIELSRGLAAAMVMLVHYHAYAGKLGPAFLLLFVGVDWFFVISGYLFAPLALGIEQTRVAPFALRRAGRLLPLYWVSLILYALLDQQALGFGRDVAVHSVLVQTWTDRETALRFNPAFWSLPAEIQFYALLPLLAAWRSDRPLSRAAWLLAFAVLMRLAISLDYNGPSSPANFATRLWFNVPGQFCEFGIGMLLYAVRQQYPRFRQAGLAVPLAAVGVAIVVTLLVWFAAVGGAFLAAHPLALTFFTLSVAAGFGLLLNGMLACLDERGTTSGVRAVAIFLGTISYGVYLLHNAIPRIAETWLGITPSRYSLVAYVVCTIALAVLANRTIEAPCRRMARRLAAQLR